MKNSKNIPQKYRVQGDTSTLVYMDGNYVIYERSNYFELMIVRYAQKDIIISGNLVRSKGDAFLPTTSEWGLYGFTIMTEERALEKLEQLKNDRRF